MDNRMCLCVSVCIKLRHLETAATLRNNAAASRNSGATTTAEAMTTCQCEPPCCFTDWDMNVYALALSDSADMSVYALAALSDSGMSVYALAISDWIRWNDEWPLDLAPLRAA